MDTLYSSGVRGKLYRLWYELYKDAQIRVKTGAGMTHTEATGENVGQGSIGGAILSSCNLDKTVTNYFAGSGSELSYATSRLQPLMFQDDTCRLVTSIEAAQKGNIILNAAMKRKQLDLNVDKCAVIVFDKKKKSKNSREAINKDQLLKIGDNMVKAKIQDKYLGDILNEGGLRKCVEATISDRYGKAFNALKEIGAVINDYRINTIGGLKAGIEIFEMAVIPSVLNNADTWVDIDNASIKRLEDLQNCMFKNLLAVPHSVPSPSLRFELGSISMEQRIDQKKLNLIFHLQNLPTSSLAKEIYELQKSYNLPGLLQECRNLIIKYNLPDIIDEPSKLSKLQWKNMVKRNIWEYSEKEIKLQFGSFSKLRDGPLMNENLKMKAYVKEMSLRDARTMFRIKTFMTKAKMNMKSNPKFANELWRCDDCKKMDSQSHIMWCPTYAPLREGKSIDNDQDLVKYFQLVFKLREENEINE